jgi:hypothetical protein
MKNSLLLSVTALLLASCGNGTSSGNPAGGDNEKPVAPLVGNWSVVTKSCSGTAQPLSSGESFVIGEGADMVVHIVTSDTDEHRCAFADGYSVVGESSTHTQVNGRKETRLQGTLSLSAQRTICWKRTATGLESEPYLDETNSVTGPVFSGLFIQRDASRVVFESDSSPLCRGGLTYLELMVKASTQAEPSEAN